MKAVIVDENVPIVANDVVRIGSKQQALAPQASDQCRLVVLQRLLQITLNERVVLDDAGCLISKIQDIDGKGQPGLGDAFLKYVSDNEFNTDKVIRVHVTKDEAGNFLAFPRDVALNTFDRADRIFVALAVVGPVGAVIVNAVDSDYSHHKKPLIRNAIRVEELCVSDLKP